MSKTRSFLENLVLVAIILVLFQTFVEDLAVLLGWTVTLRNALLIAGFAFDVFFTIEFLVRSYDAWRSRSFRRYLWLERGWIDFLASIPLLVLNSGPAVLALYVGGVAFGGAGGMLNVLKVVKAIRIARVLRLLRALKLFRRIKNADSVMAQRHVATISATVVSVFVFVLLALSLGGTIVTLPSIDRTYQEQVIAGADYLVESDLVEPGRETQLRAFAASRPEILSVEVAGEVRYSRYSQDYLRAHFQPTDYAVLARGPVEIFVNLVPFNQAQAARNLQYFVVIVVTILVLLFVYSPHFALTISDPIHVMRRGMTEKSYNLEVRVLEDYRDDDIYRLAAEYNRTYLPMKDRENASDEGEGNTSLSMDDVAGLFD